MPTKRTTKTLRGTRAAASRKPQAKKSKAVAQKAPRAAKPSKKVSDGTMPIYDMKGHTKENFTLDPMFVKDAVNTDVIYQAVLMYQAGEREGTAATLTRGEVSGGGKKPWKQKGTGQARHGSRRSPIWRHGGSVFGPHPRDYSYSIPQEIRRQAVVEGLKDKLQGGKFMMVERLDLSEPKTKHVAGFMQALKLEKPLLLVEQKSEGLMRASRNISSVSIKTAAEVNALDVVSHHECVITKGAYPGLLKRLKP